MARQRKSTEVTTQTTASNINVMEVKEPELTPEEKFLKEEADREAQSLMAQAIERANNKHIRIGLITDTPYCSKPSLNTNVVGVLPKGSVFDVKKEIDGDDGSFWDIGLGRYINKDWNVIIYCKKKTEK